METWQLIVLFVSCFLGGSTVFYFKNDNSRQLKLILSFSGAFLFAITVLHLIPDVYRSGGEKTGLFVLAGFFFQILLEQFSQGVEHGHIHRHSHEEAHAAFPLGIMISLCLHAVMEGIPIAGNSRDELVFGIALHHIPAAFALATILVQHQMKRNTVILFLLLFSSMTPAGYFLGWLFGESGHMLNPYFDKIMGFVIGIFLHISTTILFESSVDHHFNRRKLIAVLLGTAVALITLLH
jgi:zinc transporter ZupT